MKITVDRDTKICGFGLTEEEAISSMKFNIERSGRLSQERLQRRKDIHAWLPMPTLLQIKGVAAVHYNDGRLTNLRTGQSVRVRVTPMAHYKYLFSVLGGALSYEDFTLTLQQEINQFFRNISETFLELNDFPYIKPVENFQIKAFHDTVIPELSFIETKDNSIVLSYKDRMVTVDKMPGVESSSLMAYLLASVGFTYDGKDIRRIT